MISLNSKITQAILGHLFLHEGESFYVNELTRTLNLDKRNLVKKIRELEQEGLIVSEKRGREIFFRINNKYALFKEYQKIILKTFGIENQLKDIFKSITGVTEAYIIGSYAKNQMDAASDIDVLVIGTASTIDISRKISILQKNINREINLINMTEKEVERKRNSEPFLKNVFKEKRIKII